MQPPPESMINMANTKLGARAMSLEKNIGNGVNKILVANENKTNPAQNANSLSPLTLSFTICPSKALNAKVMPLCVKFSVLSILAKPLSNVKRGSATKIADDKKAARFNKLQSNKIDVLLKPWLDKKNPRSNPITQPIFVSSSYDAKAFSQSCREYDSAIKTLFGGSCATWTTAIMAKRIMSNAMLVVNVKTYRRAVIDAKDMRINSL